MCSTVQDIPGSQLAQPHREAGVNYQAREDGAPMPAAVTNLLRLMDYGQSVSVTPRRLIQDPYYGSREALDAELAKATAAQRELLAPGQPANYTIPAKMGAALRQTLEGYTERIDQPVQVNAGENAAEMARQRPHYNSATAQAFVPPPSQGAGVFRRNADGSAETRGPFDQMAANPIHGSAATLEHEVGHHLAGVIQHPQSRESLSGGMFDPHLRKPNELINGLGKINRERYFLQGERFDSDTLDLFLQGERAKPPADRYQGYSPEARRVFDAIIGELPSEGSKWGGATYNAARALVPLFVTADSQPVPLS